MMLIHKIQQQQPLVHCITNIVVANFQANGLLALGASPVMADAVEEALEIATVSKCTVLNVGTLKSDSVKSMLVAGKTARKVGNPVVLDPVGAGATTFRKETVLTLLDEIDITLIRCNAGEIAAIAGSEWQAKGVDAGTGDADVAQLAQQVAREHACLVAVSGEFDLVTDGERMLVIEGGHAMMSRVTGMGCLLSSVAGAYLAVAEGDPIDAVAEALTYYKRAGERAAQQSQGLGDFAMNFINALQGELV